jgi:hypothetical protein
MHQPKHIGGSSHIVQEKWQSCISMMLCRPCVSHAPDQTPPPSAVRLLFVCYNCLPAGYTTNGNFYDSLNEEFSDVEFGSWQRRRAGPVGQLLRYVNIYHGDVWWATRGGGKKWKLTQNILDKSYERFSIYTRILKIIIPDPYGMILLWIRNQALPQIYFLTQRTVKTKCPKKGILDKPLKSHDSIVDQIRIQAENTYLVLLCTQWI